MTLTEVFSFCIVLPLALAGGWVMTYRLWTRSAEAGQNITWLTGRAAGAGFNSFLFPGVAGFTLMWLGSLVDIAMGRPDSSLTDPSSWLLGVGFCLLLVGFWMWAFAWPRFLVPPVARGLRGWVPELWHRWRSPDERDAPDRSSGSHVHR